MTQGGAAEKAGLQYGDKLLSINGTDVVSVQHEVAVNAMKHGTEQVILLVQRATAPVQPTRVSGLFGEDRRDLQTSDHSLDASFLSDVTEIARESISVTLKRDHTGSPGFSVAGGAGSGHDGIFISSITPGGPADRYGKIQVTLPLFKVNERCV